ncbi:perC transcriptional activator family protein [Enterobacter asburiae]|uniref:perC transcriptional activator family protein n=1 Tax=Enterobacter asburiae TaxID=61645 RepID=UPI002075639C|nr:perC transcriptional activator family protein [Enterobacter asburiae]MCM7687651.1 perC transcriptional activator family protein [Enterobacter asburiae]HAS1003898.1 perC transcriptional activator family protein [Enterobacter cloacae]
MKKTKLERYHEDYVSQRRKERMLAVTPEAMEIESRAIERERRGHYRIAARLWLQCLDAAVGEVERARIAVRRQQCITWSNKITKTEYSGIGCRGVVYD